MNIITIPFLKQCRGNVGYYVGRAARSTVNAVASAKDKVVETAKSNAQGVKQGWNSK